MLNVELVYPWTNRIFLKRVHACLYMIYLHVYTMKTQFPPETLSKCLFQNVYIFAIFPPPAQHIKIAGQYIMYHDEVRIYPFTIRLLIFVYSSTTIM